MRLITAFELAAKKESELDALYSRIAPEHIGHGDRVVYRTLAA